jgi:hypothetical protein
MRVGSHTGVCRTDQAQASTPRSNADFTSVALAMWLATSHAVVRSHVHVRRTSFAGATGAFNWLPVAAPVSGVVLRNAMPFLFAEAGPCKSSWQPKSSLMLSSVTLLTRLSGNYGQCRITSGDPWEKSPTYRLTEAQLSTSTSVKVLHPST